MESGPGVLAFLAAQHGAGRVTCVEQSPSMYKIAKKTLENNRYWFHFATLYKNNFLWETPLVKPVS